MLVAFVVALFAAKVAGRDAPLAIAIGLGGTLGLLAVYSLATTADHHVPVHSSVIVLFYVFASIFFAYWLSRRESTRSSTRVDEEQSSAD